MSLVTLTTDFGYKDYFVAAIKAALLQEIPEVKIIDISHKISPFNLTEAAYILKNGYKAFPKGTLHIIGVESELTPENSHLVMKFDGHYFIGANNGILSLVIENQIWEKVVEINIHQTVISSFPVLDVFVKVAGHLSRNGALEVIGKPIAAIKELIDVNPVINELGNKLIGSVIYIDNFGNVVTNIKKSLFLEVQKARPFEILTKNIKFEKIYDAYSEAINYNIPKENRDEDGKKIALWNAAQHLELAIYKSNPMTVGSAHSLYGLHFRDTVTIKFD